tara:strand:+ start:198 stop:683 length:486 start_codon:yes stop_codon:yes gene_type:complete
MKSNIDKVYSKLPNKKHNLGKQKVDLSLISELESALSNVQSFDKAENDFNDVVETAKKFNSLLEQIRPVAREFISEYDSLKKDYDGLANATENFKDRIFEYQIGLRELGLDDMSDQVKNYYDELTYWEVLDSKIFNYNYQQEELVGVDFTSLMSWAKDIEE